MRQLRTVTYPTSICRSRETSVDIGLNMEWVWAIPAFTSQPCDNVTCRHVIQTVYNSCCILVITVWEVSGHALEKRHSLPSQSSPMLLSDRLCYTCGGNHRQRMCTRVFAKGNDCRSHTPYHCFLGPNSFLPSTS